MRSGRLRVSMTQKGARQSPGHRHGELVPFQEATGDSKDILGIQRSGFGRAALCPLLGVKRT